MRLQMVPYRTLTAQDLGLYDQKEAPTRFFPSVRLVALSWTSTDLAAAVSLSAQFLSVTADHSVVDRPTI